MARPAKSAAVTAKHLTAKEKEDRLCAENALMGETRRITPPKHLTKDQKKIFRFIVKELENAKILCALDTSVLAQCAIATDMLRRIDQSINEEPALLRSTSFMSARKQYMSDLFRCSSELSLSPQSRAKLANLSLAANKKDPLIEALQADDDDEEEPQSAEDFDTVESGGSHDP